MENLAPEEYRPRRIHLNTASSGLLARSAAEAIRAAVERREYGGEADAMPAVTAARAAFARLAGVPVSRVAAGTSVATCAAPSRPPSPRVPKSSPPRAISPPS